MLPVVWEAVIPARSCIFICWNVALPWKPRRVAPPDGIGDDGHN